MSIQRFKDWIIRENSLKKFAKTIHDGTTVYFSDDLAACYDLMIRGFLNDKNNIVIEFEKSFVGENYIERAIDIWINEAGWELWYIDTNFQWMILANEKGRKKYNANDLIKSNRINFEFKLNQLL